CNFDRNWSCRTPHRWRRPADRMPCRPAGSRAASRLARGRSGAGEPAGFRMMLEIGWLIAWVAAGSALGGLARFFVSGLVARAFGETFPWGTMIVNVSGAFAIGVL